MRKIRAAINKIELRDVVGIYGCAFAWYGLEQIYPGAGFTAVGVYLAGIAVIAR